MTDIYNENEELTLNSNSKPIHGSMFLLTIKIIFAVFIFDIFYALALYLLALIIGHPITAAMFLSSLFVKNISEVSLVVYIVLQWATTIYYISGNHLISRKGIFHIKEDVYEFKTIRSLEIEQSILGRIFHYGNVVLKTSASGGYLVVVTLMGLADPQSQEKILNKYF